MPSSKPHPLWLYPASWLQAVRDAFEFPGQRSVVLTRRMTTSSELETQQRKLRAFITAYRLCPRVDPAVTARLDVGWTIKTHRKVYGQPGAEVVSFELSAHPPRTHEIELVKKAIAGG